MLMYFPSLVSAVYIQLPYLGHHCELQFSVDVEVHWNEVIKSEGIS